MATTTSRLALRKPDPDPVTGDFMDVGLDLNDNLDKIDAAMDCAVVTSSTRPASPFRGQLIYETDTFLIQICTNNVGPVWAPVWVGTTGGTFTGNFRTQNDIVQRASGDTQDRLRFDVATGQINWGSGSATTDTNLKRVSADVLGTDDSFSVLGDVIYGSENGIAGPATTSGTDTCTTTSTYQNLAGTGSVTSFSFVKRVTASRIRIDLSATFYSSAVTSGPKFGVRLNSTDYDVCQLRATLANAAAHLPCSGFIYIPSGVPAGTYTVQGRWTRMDGAATLSRDSGDWLAISARECK